MEFEEILSELISPGLLESSITSDSNIGRDGLGVNDVNTVSTFNMETAILIDSQLKWNDVVSLIFLIVEKKDAALKLINMVEEKEENKMSFRKKDAALELISLVED